MITTDELEILHRFGSDDVQALVVEVRRLNADLAAVRTIYKKLVARGGDSLTYSEWAQIGDIVDPIPGRALSTARNDGQER